MSLTASQNPNRNVPQFINNSEQFSLNEKKLKTKIRLFPYIQKVQKNEKELLETKTLKIRNK